MNKLTISKVVIPVALITLSVLCVIPFLMIIFTSFAIFYSFYLEKNISVIR